MGIATKHIATSSKGFDFRTEPVAATSVQTASPLATLDRAEAFGHRILQRKCASCATEAVGENEVYQREAAPGASPVAPTAAPALANPNKTGMPDDLKAGIEALSGMDMSNVRVHRNSTKPSDVEALAYAQGNEIHLGPGQDKHLAHEAWHLVQQRQGRVRVTGKVAGKGVNDDTSLEHEAEQMGQRALQMKVDLSAAGARGRSPIAGLRDPSSRSLAGNEAPIQGFWPFTDSHAPPSNMGQRVQALRTALTNSTPHNRANAGWLAGQQNDLHDVENDVHAWLRDHGHHATERQRQEMANHLHALEDHHTALIGVQRAHNHPLWLPAATSGPERLRANQIWNDVQNNTGNLTIDNANAGFRDNTLADVAKLLQQQRGRDILHELNTNPNHVANGGVQIGADWSGAFGLAGRPHQAGSWATPNAADTQLHRLQMDTGAPNTGIGSYVQIDRTHRETETGAHGDAGIPMPHYVTLGHELGHALHNLRGTSVQLPQHRPAFSGMGQLEQSLWSNPEEHQNITDNENVIRTEHGLPTRAFHRPPDIVRQTRGYFDLRDRINQAYEDFPDQENVLNNANLHLDPDEPATIQQASDTVSSLYRWRNMKRGALAIGGLGLSALAGYGLFRAYRGT